MKPLAWFSAAYLRGSGIRVAASGPRVSFTVWQILIIDKYAAQQSAARVLLSSRRGVCVLGREGGVSSVVASDGSMTKGLTPCRAPAKTPGD